MLLSSPLSRRIGAVLVAGALLATGCGGDAGPGGAQRSPDRSEPTAPVAYDTSATVTFSLNFSPKSLDPGVGNIGWNTMQLGAGETLQRVTRDGRVEPWLAQSVTPVDDRTWQIALRPGVTFHDGSPVDAAAVKASLERSVAKLPNIATLLDVASIEVRGPATLVIVSRNPNPGLPSALAHFNSVIHDARKAEADNAAFATSPNLTGSFVPTGFRVDAGVKMIRNERYWGDKANVAAVDVRFVPDAAVRTASVLAGEVDLAYQLPPESLTALRAKPGVSVASVTTGYQYFIIFNTRKAIFADAAVRKALADAIDRDSLAKNVMLGTAKPATGAISPIFPFALTSGGQGGGPAAAERQLDAAGWVRGSDGVRARAGQRLSFTMLTYPQRPELGNLAVAIQSQLKTIGIEFQIKTVDQINTELGGNDWDASMYAVNTAPTGDPAPLFNTYFRSTGGSNFGKFSDPAIDRAVDALGRIADPDARRAAAVELQKQLNQLAPHAFLLVPQFNVATSGRLVYEPFPSDYYIIDNRLGVRR